MSSVKYVAVFDGVGKLVFLDNTVSSDGGYERD